MYLYIACTKIAFIHRYSKKTNCSIITKPYGSQNVKCENNSQSLTLRWKLLSVVSLSRINNFLVINAYINMCRVMESDSLSCIYEGSAILSVWHILLHTYVDTENKNRQ